MSEATCGGAQRNHTSVAGGEFSERQKPLKSKDFSRRQIPLQSRESPVRIGPGTPCFSKAPNLSRIFSFMEAPHFREVAPGDRGPASQDDAAAAPSLINNFRSTTPLPLMSEATCGGAQRNHTSVAGGDFAKIQKSVKNKGFSRRPIPLKSRESPVRVNHTSVAGGECTEIQKSLKGKDFSRRQIPLQSRESPVRIGPGTPCLTKAPNLSRIFSFMEAPHFREVAPGDRGPASQDGAAAAPSLINNFRSTTPLPLMSEATCGGAQRNHTSVAGGDCTEIQKPLKSNDLSRRPIPLQSRESPVRSSIAPTPPVPIFNPGPRYFIAAPIALG